MKEQSTKNRDNLEIEFKQYVITVLRKAWFIVLVSVVGAVIAATVSKFCITPLYQSTAVFYVNNKSISIGGTLGKISSSDLLSSRSLIDSYIVILDTRETLEAVIDHADVEYSYAQLKEMILAATVDETEIFRVVVSAPDPEEADRIADAIAEILPQRIDSIVESSSSKIVDTAVIAGSPSSPSLVTNTIVGFLLGAVLSLIIVTIQEMHNVIIRTEEDVQKACSHPLLVSVPDMAGTGKGSGYDSAYANRKKTGTGAGTGGGKRPRPEAFVGSSISFAAAEAYKLLRTKLQFAFPEEKRCRVIGITSALSGEGKSLSAVNLAHSLAELDKKVLVMDCDMRRPTLAEKLNIHKKPGLSGYLTGQRAVEEVIQSCSINGGTQTLYAIAAGQNPPNPVELLSCQGMKNLIAGLREEYDYVIIDLPPIGEVSDALTASELTDGMLLVVRQKYCDRVVLKETVRQLQFVDARVLGIVFNSVSETGNKLRYYRRYSRYGRKYYRSGYRRSGKNSSAE